MSKDLINGKTDDLPETKSILKILRIKKINDNISEDEIPDSFLKKKRINDSKVKDDQRIIDSEKIF